MRRYRTILVTKLPKDLQVEFMKEVVDELTEEVGLTKADLKKCPQLIFLHAFAKCNDPAFYVMAMEDTLKLHLDRNIH
jgi:hypothetical protein